MVDDFRSGDRIRLECVDAVYEGILLPRSQLFKDSHVILKLDSGYNIGIEKKRIKKRALIERNPPKPRPEKREKKFDDAKPTVSVLSTGGTISSKIDYRTGGVYASYTAQDLLDVAPELEEFANLKSRAIMNVMSEDMTPKGWVEIAEAVIEEFAQGADGVVVTHGTDTMHYSTAALSFLLKNLGKPVVFTGSQRSSDRGSSDGFMNLICSVIFAASDYAGVYLVMHGSMEDDYCLAHPGTKVRKMHTSRRDAFQSINASPVARILPTGEIEPITKKYLSRSDVIPSLDGGFADGVALVKVYPGMLPELIDFYVDKGFKGIVLEGTALGHVPTNNDISLLPSIENARDKGVLIAMTTQCLYGRVHPHVYTNLRELSSRGVVFCGDMLPETCYVKLRWVLNKTQDPSEAEKLLLADVAGEITEKTSA